MVRGWMGRLLHHILLDEHIPAVVNLKVQMNIVKVERNIIACRSLF